MQALELYTEAIQQDSRMAAAYSNRALVHLKLSQPEAAEADCNHALELEPSNAKAILRRAAARSVSTPGPILILQMLGQSIATEALIEPDRIYGSCSNVWQSN